MHVDLASGHSIEITPITGLKAKHRDAYEGAPKIYMKFNEKGEPDMSGMPLSMSLAKLQRNALMATLISGWTFRVDDEDVTSPILPIPKWTGMEIENDESFGEIPLDDFNEITDLLQPYIDKVVRKPDPKETTTAGSTDA
ncbi:MAG TPA: hypothetical protein VMU95_41295 [Trebonia sp.]|nr:hypothetical protein [Trebonia sp.]